jgi:hypothetical protein
MGGSSIVTMRPMMTRLPPAPGSVALALLVGTGEPPVAHDGVGERVPGKAQPVTRASTASAADNGSNPLRDAGMGHTL